MLGTAVLALTPVVDRREALTRSSVLFRAGRWPPLEVGERCEGCSCSVEDDCSMELAVGAYIVFSVSTAKLERTLFKYSAFPI